MWHLTKVYLTIIPVFLLLDYLWLGQIMAGFYRRELGSLARRSGDSVKPDIPSAIGVYLLIPLGIVLFALPHVSHEHLVASSLLWGFLYGIVLYGVYDLTNYSVIKKYSGKLALVDILWGGALNSVMTLVAAYVQSWTA